MLTKLAAAPEVMRALLVHTYSVQIYLGLAVHHRHTHTHKYTHTRACARTCFVAKFSCVFVQVMRFPVECYACSVTGETRMCVTDVPHFKEIIIMSFLCEECGFRSVEVKGGGAVPDHGTISTLHFTPGTVRALCFEGFCAIIQQCVLFCEVGGQSYAFDRSVVCFTSRGSLS